MARDTINSGGSGSRATHREIERQEAIAKNAQLQADEAVAQALQAADQAQQIAQQEAGAIAAQALADQEEANLNPAAKRQAILARVNAKNIDGEKERRMAKGLQILQAKSLPFQVEEILQQPDTISLNLNEDETTELLEKLLTDTWRFCIDYRKSNDYTNGCHCTSGTYLLHL
jgi:hypothetical protein